MFCCDFLDYFEVICSVTKGVYGMQDLHCLSISNNKKRSLCDTSAQNGLPLAWLHVSIFHSLSLRSFPDVLLVLLCSQELALQLPPYSLARQINEGNEGSKECVGLMGLQKCRRIFIEICFSSLRRGLQLFTEY